MHRLSVYIILFCTHCVTLATIGVNDEYFSLVGKVSAEYNPDLLGEFQLENSRQTRIQCGALCVENVRCTMMELCGNNSRQCRLWQGVPPTGNNSLTCYRYQMVHLCVDGEFYDRYQNKCISHTSSSTVASVTLTSDTTSSKDDTTTRNLVNFVTAAPVDSQTTSKIVCSTCDCISDYKTVNGVYNLSIGGNAVGVVCRFGSIVWTTIQQRLDGSENFLRDWDDYENGFGSPYSEFWLGNKYIYYLTSVGLTYLRVVMMDHNGEERYADYSSFRVSDSSDHYRLQISGYTGNAGDSLAYHNGMKFSTFDKDNDLSSVSNCAFKRRGAWWYNACHKSNLNGEYGNNDFSNGTNWYTWKGFYYSLKRTRMMIRKP